MVKILKKIVFIPFLIFLKIPHAYCKVQDLSLKLDKGVQDLSLRSEQGSISCH